MYIIIHNINFNIDQLINCIIIIQCALSLTLIFICLWQPRYFFIIIIDLYMAMVCKTYGIKILYNVFSILCFSIII